jgi:predicted metalloprotease with PDZ domain
MRDYLAVRYFLVFLAVASATASLAECVAPRVQGTFLAYTIQPKLAGDALLLEVDLRFRLANQKTTKLSLPSQWNGEQQLYKAIRNLTVLTPSATLQATESASSRSITFPVGQVVHLTYEVVQDWQPGSAGAPYFRVILNSSFFQVTGRNFLVYPLLPEHQVLPVFVEWKNVPSTWNVADSLGGGQLCQSETTELLNLTNGLYVGGDFRVHEAVAEGQPVSILVRGKWNFSDNSFVSLATTILRQERTFWRDIKNPYYLISLSPSEGTSGSYAGTALENSFAMLMAPGASLDFEMKFVLAHEIFHAWNPAKLGEVDGSNPPYWFTEGFTDYYARLSLLRSGSITLDEYVNAINEAYRSYMTSPVLRADAGVVRARFYSDADVQRLPYQRGSLLALRWNEAMRLKRKNAKSLDDVMLGLRLDATRSEQILDDAALVARLAAYIGPEARDDVQKYLNQGEVIPLNGGELGPCAGIADMAAFSYDPGLDLESTLGFRTVTGVKPDSEAYRAGLRDGQHVLAHNEIAPGDASRMVILVVRAADQEKRISYYPRGQAFHISQFQLDATRLSSPQCEDWFR